MMNTIADTTDAAVLGVGDALFGARGNFAIGTRSIAGLTPDAIDTIVQLGRNRTSPQSVINWHNFHGEASRTPLADAAFGLRRDHPMVEMFANWPEGEAATHRAWASDAADGLAAHALPGGYPNLLGPDRHEQIAHACGQNAARLLAAKARYDPTGAFVAISLPTHPAPVN